MEWLHLNATNLLALVVAAATWILRSAVLTPKDSERAALLATLANDAAAVVVSLTPNARWSQMLRDVIARLAAEATRPTDNRVAMEKAATAALMRLGQLPDTPEGLLKP